MAKFKKDRDDRHSQQHMTTSIGNSRNTRVKSKNRKRVKTRYRGQGR